MDAVRPRLLAVCPIWVAILSGCASVPYQFGSGWQHTAPVPCDSPPADALPEVCEGRPNKFVDGVGWVIGIPGKVLLWDRRVNNHAVSAETITAVSEYAEQNRLEGVCVRVNQYAPGDEWRRLRENRQVGAGWRYTLGTLSLVGYTLIPGRLVGGDHYNPFTNSVYVYSDVPSLVIQSAAYAKDVQCRKYPGTYAAVNELPVASLWHETVNTKDALGYVYTTGDQGQQVEALRILHPYYGMRVGSAFGGFLFPEPVFVAGGAVVGHVSGRIQAHRLPEPEETGSAPNRAIESTRLTTGQQPASESAATIVRAQQAE